jgi:hypothetical protein
MHCAHTHHCPLLLLCTLLLPGSCACRTEPLTTRIAQTALPLCINAVNMKKYRARACLLVCVLCVRILSVCVVGTLILSVCVCESLNEKRRYNCLPPLLLLLLRRPLSLLTLLAVCHLSLCGWLLLAALKRCSELCKVGECASER